MYALDYKFAHSVSILQCFYVQEVLFGRCESWHRDAVELMIEQKFLEVKLKDMFGME